MIYARLGPKVGTILGLSDRYVAVTKAILGNVASWWRVCLTVCGFGSSYRGIAEGGYGEFAPLLGF